MNQIIKLPSGQKKQSLSTLAVQGLRDIIFGHQSPGGETSINVAALVTPTDLTANGLQQPLPERIAAAHMLQYKESVEVSSSAKGPLLMYDAFTVASDTVINLGFTTLVDEIFVVKIKRIPSNAALVADARVDVKTVLLAQGAVVINHGIPYLVNENPTQQVGALLVFNGQGRLLKRNVGNAAAAPGADGNYHEDAPGAGQLYSQSMTLNVGVADVAGEQFVVMPAGALVERSNDSMLAHLEAVQGQVDAMRPYLAALAGVSESLFQGAPNSIDLQTFGAMVLALQATVATLQTPPQVCMLRWAAGATRLTISNSAQAIPMNEAFGDTAMAPLAANQFVLQPGVYDIDFSATIYGGTSGGTDIFRIYMYNVTDATEVSSSPVNEINPPPSQGFLTAQTSGAAAFQLATAKTFELRVIKAGYVAGTFHVGDTYGAPYDKHAWVKIRKARGY